MGSNNVVSIRVEALGVSITIADGSIAIEQTKTEIPAAAVLKAEGPVAATGGAAPASGCQPLPDLHEIPVRPFRPVTERVPPLPKRVDDSAVRKDGISPTGEKFKNLPTTDAENSAPVIDELEQTLHRSSPPGSNGPTGLPGDSAKDQEARSSQTTLWSDEEIEKLKALYPTHSASAIAKQMGQGFNAVRAKRGIWSEKGGAFDRNREIGGSKTYTEAEAVVRRRDGGNRYPYPMVSAPCRCSIVIPVNIVG